MKYNYCLQFYAVLILELFLVFENSDHSCAGNNSISSRLHTIRGSFWPDGLVPYDVSSDLSEEMVSAVQYAVDYMNTVRCVKWELRRPSDRNYVTFQRIEDSMIEPICASNVGRILDVNEFDFKKREKSHYEYDSPYDFHSIMQYKAVRFIRPVPEFVNIGLGRADGKLSPIDIVNVRHLYCGEQSFCNRSINMNLCEGEQNRVKRNQCEN